MPAEFKTTDVDLAAFLACREQRVARVEPPLGPPWIAEFVFEHTHALDVALREWGDLEESCFVDARLFAKRRVRLYRWARNVVDEATGRR